MSGQRAILFIDIQEEEDGTTTFSITEEAKAILRSMKDKLVSVVTIVGPQRTGKSFLANRLLTRMNGFAIGPSTVPCTRGLWIWSQPLDVGDMSVLILDTEGMDSVFRDGTTDVKIFAISLLLSTILVYNTMGHIDEGAIDSLNLVIRMVEMIKVTDKKKGASYKELSRYFPFFMWALRDFSLDLQGASSDEYLDKCLREVESNDPQVVKKNAIRKTIKELFRDRTCLTFVRPLNDESKLSRIEEQNYNDLRPEFRTSVHRFLSTIHTNLKPKMIDGKGVTGNMLLELATQYVNAFNSGGFPVIKTSLERVLNSEASALFQKVFSKYINLLGTKLSKNTVKSFDMYQKIFEEILEMLDEELWHISNLRKNYQLYWILRKKVKKKLKVKFDDYISDKKLKRDKYKSELARSFDTNMGIPKNGPFDSFFNSDKLGKFHTQMIAWVDRSLKSDDKELTTSLLTTVCKYYERYVSEGKSIAVMEMDKTRDELEIEKNTNQSFKDMVNKQESIIDSNRDQIRKLRAFSERLQREIEVLKKTSVNSNQGSYARISTLEQQCEDLKNENMILQRVSSLIIDFVKKRKKLEKEISVLKKNPGMLGSTSTSKNISDVEEIDRIENDIKTLSESTDLNSGEFLEIFEKYKKATSKEMLKMRKNMTYLMQENNKLKSAAFEADKKGKELEAMKAKFDNLKRDMSEFNSKMKTNQLEEEFTRVKSKLMELQANKDVFFYVLQESLKRAKKKKNNLEAALNMLNPDDMEEVIRVYDILKLKFKLKFNQE